MPYQFVFNNLADITVFTTSVLDGKQRPMVVNIVAPNLRWAKDIVLNVIGNHALRTDKDKYWFLTDDGTRVCAYYPQSWYKKGSAFPSDFLVVFNKGDNEAVSQILSFQH